MPEPERIKFWHWNGLFLSKFDTMKLNLYPLIFTLALASHITLNAQITCVGEEIRFRETFGSGYGSSALPAGRTNYNYNGNSALNDGDYKLYRNTQGKPEWVSSTDHTGDGNGKMMVINASFSAGEFFRDTVSGLSSGRFYTVYLYAMNVNTLGTCGATAILPKVQVIVEYLAGSTWTELTTFSSAFIPQAATAQWVRVSGGFMAPTGVSSVRYRILNNSAGGCGNDLAIDDISFSQCAGLGTVLPITGLTINVEQKNSAAVISFSTEAEENTKTFETEKSYDGKTWNVIHIQPAAGNSSVKRSYTTTDANLSSGTVYYRIKETDFDGGSIWSPVITFKPDDAAQASAAAFPNPFANNISVQFRSSQNEVTVLRLIDQAGRTVQNTAWNLRKGFNMIQLDNVEKLQKGFYIIELRNSTGVKLYSGNVVKK
jgi:large repetitive protein